MSDDETVEVFQDLVLSGPESRRDTLRAALIKYATTPWRHAVEVEDDLDSNSTLSEASSLVFERAEGNELPSVRLFLWPRSAGLEVTNIVPRQSKQLSYQEYNGVLVEFCNKLATPAANEAGFAVTLSGSRKSIFDWLPKHVADALINFSRSANKSTGSSHPMDEERWLRFLIAAHDSQVTLSTDALRRWLIEVEQWPSDQAWNLVIQYEHARTLLDVYDKRRR